MTIRHASAADVPQIVALLHRKRQQYQHYSPIFWRMADRPADAQEPYIRRLVENADVTALVNDDNGHITGALIATYIDAPPVYDPGGKVCMIDDYAVEPPGQWADVGVQLLETCREHAKAKGCALQLIVCGQKDVPKSTMLKSTGAEVASEWYVRAV